MTIKRVRAAIEARVKTWAAANSLHVAWQGVGFKPTVGTTYIRLALIPGETGNPIMGTGHRRLTGVAQIDVVAPDGVGMGPAEALAESLCAEFKRGVTLTNGGLQIIMDTSPTIARPLIENGWLWLPVWVPYRADDFNP